jgi:hypothetical protein
MALTGAPHLAGKVLCSKMLLLSTCTTWKLIPTFSEEIFLGQFEEAYKKDGGMFGQIWSCA